MTTTGCDRCANHCTVPILEVDRDGCIVGFNAAARTMLGAVELGAPACAALASAADAVWELRPMRGAHAPVHPDLLAAATTGIVARGITHDLNNLFTCILASATAPPRADLDTGRHMTAIKQAVLRGAELLNLLRELSPQVDARHCEVGEVVEWCGLLLERVGAKMCVEVIATADDAEAAIPAHALQQILINLGLNSIDAMAERGGRLDLGATARGDRVLVRVADNGPGIPPARLTTLFEPGRSTKAGHSGVGLSVVRQIVRAAGGTIRVESAPESGTCFVIELPAAEV